MKTASAKAKGRNLQNWTAQKLREHLHSQTGLDLTRDVNVAIMGTSGRDILLTPLAEKHFDFDIECKNVENLNLWRALKQAEANTQEGRKPMLIIKRNREKPYVVLKAEDYFQQDNAPAKSINTTHNT